MSAERRDVENTTTLVRFVLAMQIFWQVAELRLSLYIFFTIDAFLLGLSFSFDLRVLRFHERNDGLAHPERRAQVGIDVRLPLLSGGYIFHRSIAGREESARDTCKISYLVYLTPNRDEL